MSMEVWDTRSRLFLLFSSLLVVLPLILGGPSYSGGMEGMEIDAETLADIFGNQARGGYGGDIDEEEWQIVPINLIPDDDDCGPMHKPVAEPQMQRLHEEYPQVEVIKALPNKKCDFYTETQGFECVPYYQCGDDGTIITDGAGLIDVRFGGDGLELAMLDASDMMCTGSMDVCCKDPDFAYTTTTTTTAAPPRTAPPVHPTEAPTPTPTPAPEPLVLYQPECGKRNPHGLGVKVSGYSDDEAQFGEWPHICAVLKKEIVAVEGDGYAGGQQQQEEEEILVFQAGASLIAPGVVLTAAHKVIDFVGQRDKLVVRCGEWDTQTESEPLAHQDRDVTHIVTHPEFNSRNLGNTVALLFLNAEFQLADHIDTICLPQFQGTYDDLSECYVKGWGKDEFGKAGQYQVVLKEIKLPMVHTATCQDFLRRTRLGRRFRLDPSFICAGGEEGKDACRGDGGGPLVCPNPEDPSRYIQVGVVAWGIGCGQQDVPGVYTDVSKQVCWIDWAMRCYLGDSYQLQYTSECNDWLSEKQNHRVPGIAAQYRECQVTWPSPERHIQQEQTEDYTIVDAYGGVKGESTLPVKIKSPTKGAPQTKTGGY